MVGRLLHGPRQGGTASCRVWAVNHFRLHYGVVACTQDATPPTGAALTPAFLQDLAYRSMELQAKATCDVTLVVLHVKPCLVQAMLEDEEVEVEDAPEGVVMKKQSSGINALSSTALACWTNLLSPFSLRRSICTGWTGTARSQGKSPRKFSSNASAK